ncbi:hypothetical protein B0H17DRAFT_1213270 [Mycena rosella]|uniref:Core-binding (CB) domain-containing protein n=1 Tax=Mycena rosella TaxID=1033263 RepID=A0AAD7CQI8_MYCRO|nr:hypothetical protein B0H17DRAFT_1213270 [Mycena rosella]
MSVHPARLYVDNALKRRQMRAANKPYSMFTVGPTHCAQKPSNISREAEAKIQHAIQHAWTESTLWKYGNGLDAFLHFCCREGITRDQCLPANEFLLCAFAASRVREIAGGTARGAIAAVKAWHVVHGEQWQGGLQLRYTL